MPGLDPGIHTMPLQEQSYDLRTLNALMDRRVKPGDDTARMAVVC